VRCVDGDLLGWWGGLSNSIVDWRASNSYRRLLVTGQEGDWRLVQASSSIDVDGVGDVFCRFRFVDCWMKRFVLASWGEEKAAVWCERQSSEERRESLVEVDWRIPNA
jgi:hypothetical protein